MKLFQAICKTQSIDISDRRSGYLIQQIRCTEELKIQFHKTLEPISQQFIECDEGAGEGDESVESRDGLFGTVLALRCCRGVSEANPNPFQKRNREQDRCTHPKLFVRVPVFPSEIPKGGIAHHEYDVGLPHLICSWNRPVASWAIHFHSPILASSSATLHT